MKKIIKIFAALLVVVIFCSAGIPVSAETKDQPEVPPAASLESAYYKVDDQAMVIGPVLPDTSEADILSRILAEGELSLSDGVKTGSQLLGFETSGSYTLSVWSDCNGDGYFSVSDMLMLQSYLLGMREFSDAQLPAADVSGDGNVSVTDYLQMKSKLLEVSSFTGKPPAGSYAGESALLAPGESCNFGSETDAVTVRGSAVTWEAGVITAAGIGTASVSNGNMTMLVTVCEEPLQISFGQTEFLVDPAETGQLNPQLNHPVDVRITYSVEDESVASVNEKGVVTPHAQGVTSVTATLPNGQKASQTLRVAPMVKSISLSDSSMKIKNNGSSKTLGLEVLPAHNAEEVIWTSSDPSVAAVSQDGVVTAVKDGYATITCSSKYGKVSASCTVKVCDLVQVALTFDDGPSSSYTGLVLDALEKYNVTATFFMVGNRINNTTAPLLRRMVADGHELGYHTWAHTYFFNMSKSEIRNDFSKFQNKLMEVCGQEATVYRAPGGNITGTALAELPIPHIMWSVDTRDWESRNAQKVKDAVLNGFKKDGAIILVHDIHKTTYEGVLLAFKEVEAKDMDVEFLTVTELLSRNGETPSAGKSYSKG